MTGPLTFTDQETSFQSVDGFADRMLPGGDAVDAMPWYWVERCLVSPLHGALVQSAECSAMLAEADVVAARVYNPPGWRACAYVGTPGLDLSPAQRVPLQSWPVAKGSLFDRLSAVGIVDRPITLEELFVDGRDPDNTAASIGIEPTLRPSCRLTDAFAITLPIEGACQAVLLLLRHLERPAFDAAHRDAVAARRPMLRDVMRRGLHAQRPPRLTAVAMLNRLSPTERDVLEMLRRESTEREIANHFGRSPHTVHVHVKSIYRKLGVHSRQQLRSMMRTMCDNDEIDI
ncbi:LuxR C-terminal-related transcriptional regulator [Phycisphaerales bacterium AB-hyl4]|uniref:LuxR C-terminal-related transcriptional regulator n=1 Tax=Natronomicrosphaera hydrolytica TaxID=3242702 RepID=A0ABV4U978_9BACT